MLGVGGWGVVGFQPALPMRGVTKRIHLRFQLVVISTRTPHAGSDAPPGLHREVQLISTRTPHAGSDHGLEQRDLILRISTRTPHAGSDVIENLNKQGQNVFQPALPHAGSDRNIMRKIYASNQHIAPNRQNKVHATSASGIFMSHYLVRTSRMSYASFVLAPWSYNAKNPSASYVGFAPTCSIFVSYLLPRL